VSWPKPGLDIPLLYHRGVIRRFSDKWFLLSASAALLVIAGGGVYLWKRSTAPPPPKPVAAEPAIPAGAELSFSGIVRARHVVLVPAPTDGTLESMEVGVGMEVFEAQLLGRIKNTLLESSRDAAREEMESAQSRVNHLESGLIAARLEASRTAAEASRARMEFEKAEKLYLRQQMLLREGATAKLVHDKAERGYRLAKADDEAQSQTARQAQDRVETISRDLEAAKRALEEKKGEMERATGDLSGAELLSPVDGVLIGARYKVGEEIPPGLEDLFQIGVDLNELEVGIEPDPRVRTRLRDGLPALVQILEISGDAIHAELRLDEDGKARVEFQTADVTIKPGLNAIVKIKLP